MKRISPSDRAALRRLLFLPAFFKWLPDHCGIIRAPADRLLRLPESGIGGSVDNRECDMDRRPGNACICAWIRPVYLCPVCGHGAACILHGIIRRLPDEKMAVVGCPYSGEVPGRDQASDGGGEPDTRGRGHEHGIPGNVRLDANSDYGRDRCGDVLRIGGGGRSAPGRNDGRDTHDKDDKDWVLHTFLSTGKLKRPGDNCQYSRSYDRDPGRCGMPCPGAAAGHPSFPFRIIQFFSPAFLNRRITYFPENSFPLSTISIRSPVHARVSYVPASAIRTSPAPYSPSGIFPSKSP